jgi:hypothetical protein
MPGICAIPVMQVIVGARPGGKAEAKAKDRRV